MGQKDSSTVSQKAAFVDMLGDFVSYRGNDFMVNPSSCYLCWLQFDNQDMLKSHFRLAHSMMQFNSNETQRSFLLRAQGFWLGPQTINIWRKNVL